MKLIKKSAMAIVKDNRLLVVRKKGSREYLMPGGKPEGKETPIEALARELKEEIDCSFDAASLVFLGHFEDFTSDGKAKVSIELFTGEITGTPKPSSEIEELIWVSAADALNPFLSPIIKKQILPFLVGKGMLR